jgi:hypothetical protein
MQKIYFTISILILCSCGDKKESSTSQDFIQNDSLKTTLKENTNDEKKSTLVEDKNLDDLGFELMYSETLNDLKLGLSKTQVEKILGIPEEISLNEIWEADGEYHQTYIYKKIGIELDMIGDNDESKKVNMITANKPCNFKTSKNISIGSKITELKTAYEKYYNKDSSDKETFVAGSIYGGVIFTLKNNVVESIFIGAGAE